VLDTMVWRLRLRWPITSPGDGGRGVSALGCCTWVAVAWAVTIVCCAAPPVAWLALQDDKLLFHVW
jgi:hypothetical protein